jgi:exodeoxyribonuclease-3
LGKVADWVAGEAKEYEYLMVLGDFNIAPDDRDVHDPELWREKILCSTAERAALNRFFQLGLIDTFRLFEQAENVFSWWDYRMNAFRRKMGLRIDLVLASKSMASRCTASYVDIEPRRQERPSDHAPVVAEFDC